MSDELEALNRIVVKPPPIVQVGDAPGLEKPLPTPEEARIASEALSPDHESDAVVSIIGLWASGMMLKDVLEDTFSSAPDEDEDEDGKKKKRPEPKVEP